MSMTYGWQPKRQGRTNNDCSRVYKSFLAVSIILFVSALALPFFLLFLILRIVSGLLSSVLFVIFDVVLSLFVKYIYVFRIGYLHTLYSRRSVSKAHSRQTRVDIRSVTGHLLSIYVIPCLADNYAYLIVDRSKDEERLYGRNPFLKTAAFCSLESDSLQGQIPNGLCKPSAKDYLLSHESKTVDAVLIDACDSRSILEAFKSISKWNLRSAKINLEALLTTHHHWDHQGGNRALYHEYGKQLKIYGSWRDKVDCKTHDVTDREWLEFGPESNSIKIEVLETPCHTRGSVIYRLMCENGNSCLFTGDTFFLGGCGNSFEGNHMEMMKNFWCIERLCSPGSLIFPGHEYTKRILTDLFVSPQCPRKPSEYFALTAALYRARHLRGLSYPLPTVPYSLAEELKYNPNFRPPRILANILRELWRKRTKQHKLLDLTRHLNEPKATTHLSSRHKEKLIRGRMSSQSLPVASMDSHFTSYVPQLVTRSNSGNQAEEVTSLQPVGSVMTNYCLSPKSDPELSTGWTALSICGPISEEPRSLPALKHHCNDSSCNLCHLCVQSNGHLKKFGSLPRSPTPSTGPKDSQELPNALSLLSTIAMKPPSMFDSIPDPLKRSSSYKSLAEMRKRKINKIKVSPIMTRRCPLVASSNSCYPPFNVLWRDDVTKLVNLLSSSAKDSKKLALRVLLSSLEARNLDAKILKVAEVNLFYRKRIRRPTKSRENLPVSCDSSTGAFSEPEAAVSSSSYPASSINISAYELAHQLHLLVPRNYVNDKEKTWFCWKRNKAFDEASDGEAIWNRGNSPPIHRKDFIFLLTEIGSRRFNLLQASNCWLHLTEIFVVHFFPRLSTGVSMYQNQPLTCKVDLGAPMLPLHFITEVLLEPDIKSNPSELAGSDQTNASEGKVEQEIKKSTTKASHKVDEYYKNDDIKSLHDATCCRICQVKPFVMTSPATLL